MRLSSNDPLLRHKANWRDVHDGDLSRSRTQTDCDEVLFLNEKEQLCEGSRSNLFVENDGMLLTPAQPSGLPNSCLRQDLLARGQCAEAVLERSDLERAGRIYFGNPLRGLVRALPVACAGSP